MQMLIETEIREAIQTWMPFVSILSITVKDQEMDNSLLLNHIRVSMAYTVASTNVQDTIGFTISGG
jgi:phage baseplate assembly protein W